MADLTLEESAYLAELKQGLEDIKAHPEHWDQSTWACGTSYCLAGFCQLRRDNKSPGDLVSSGARPKFSAEYPRGWGSDAWIFDGENTIEQIEEEIKRLEEEGFLYNRDGYDRDGYNARMVTTRIYNEDGYDEDGYDEYGYDEYGYDEYGYDEYGYDEDGYDEDGYDEDGYDEDGYDKDGYDKDGYDKDGYDKYGYDEYGYDRFNLNRKGEKRPTE
jgi:hypothetical protein